MPGQDMWATTNVSTLTRLIFAQRFDLAKTLDTGCVYKLIGADPCVARNWTLFFVPTAPQPPSGGGGDGTVPAEVTNRLSALETKVATILATPPAPPFPEAPKDGKQYIRMNGMWVEASESPFLAVNSPSGMGAGAQAQDSLAIGSNAVSEGFCSVAIGADSTTVDDWTVSIGSDSLKRRLVNVAPGTAATDAVNKAQLDTITPFPEAPQDGLQYARQSKGWVQVKSEPRIVVKSASPIPTTTTNGDIAIGGGAAATDSSISIGETAKGTGSTSLALGYSANASNTNAIAIGRVTSALANSSISIGAGSSAETTATLGVAIGGAAIVSHSSSVALGSGSKTSANNTISVGSTTVKRRIVNIADGVDPNDAVTKSQFDTVAAYASITPSSEALAAISTVNGIAIGPNASTAGPYSVAFGVGSSVVNTIGYSMQIGGGGAIQSAYSVAVGYNARFTSTSSNYSTAIGYGATISAPGSVVVGSNVVVGSTAAQNSVFLGASINTGSNAVATSVLVGHTASSTAANTVVLGQAAKATAAGAVAIGQGAVADSANTVSLGASGATRRLVNVADGTAPTDGATVAQLNELVARIAALEAR